MFQPTGPVKTGQVLRDALAKPPAMKYPLVDELLYRRKVTLIAADPGLGKSTLATQIAASVAAGVPVFGILEVAQAYRVYYVPFETDWDEFVLSLQRAKALIPFNEDNLIFDEGLLGIDVGALDGATNAIDRIALLKPDLIIVDPLYLLVSGDLADGGIAAKAMKWLLRLAVRCNAAVLVLHHTHRERYNQGGKKINEDDASYGSRWIKANVVIQYNLKAIDGGTEWSLKKDRYKLSRNEITLHYDPETGLSSALKSKALIKDELFGLLKWHKPGSVLTYSGLAQTLGCAEGYLAQLVTLPNIKKILKREVVPGKQVKLVRIYDETVDGPKPAAPAPNATTQPTEAAA